MPSYHYAKGLPFRGDLTRAFDLAIASLTSLGFRIVEKNDWSLELTGPGMTSTKQSGLVGATRIHIDGSARELTLEADLGGVRAMTRFVALFPMMLFLVLGAIFVAVFAVQFGGFDPSWAVPTASALGVNLVIWWVLAPVFHQFMRNRTCQALDALLNNMATVGSE